MMRRKEKRLEFAPQLRVYTTTSSVLVALRLLLDQRPEVASYGPETLAEILWHLRYLLRKPAAFEIEVALGALHIEGAVLA